MTRQELLQVIRGDRPTPSAAMLRGILSACTPGYRLAVALRNATFNLGWRRGIRLPRATVSIGNLTTGGTGKTPMVIELAMRLMQMGARPAVLLRGYKATAEQGSDEAQLIRNALGGEVPVEPDPNRAAAADRVLARHGDVNLFLLDDAFQHRQVQRDVNLVLLDATNPFGYGRLLPRGLLREPPSALGRADAVIVTRADQVDAQSLAALDERIVALTGHAPIAHAAHQWLGFFDAADQLHALDALQDEQVVAACGIGNPQAFRHTLNQLVRGAVALRAFDDHAPYTPAILAELFADARQAGASAIVTSDKDWVKWRPLLASMPDALPVYRPMLRIAFLDGGPAVDKLLYDRVVRSLVPPKHSA